MLLGDIDAHVDAKFVEKDSIHVPERSKLKFTALVF